MSHVNLAERPALERMVEEGLSLKEHGFGDQALVLFADAAGAADPVLPSIASRARRGAAWVHTSQGRWRDAAREIRRARRLAQAARDSDLVAEALNGHGMLHHTRGRIDRATSFYRLGLEHAVSARVRGVLLQNLGTIAASAKRFAEADAFFSDSEDNFRSAGYSRGLAIATNNRAAIALDTGHFGDARDRAEGAVEAARAVGDSELLSIALVNLADALYHLGRVAESEGAVAEAFGQLTMQSNPWRRAQCLQIMGNVRRELGYAPEARRCYEMGIGVLASAGVVAHGDPLRTSLRRLLEEMEAPPE
jgi:tetratricopeptide (TPR) repeat protein